MKNLTALKAKAEQARTSHAYRAEGASLRFTEDLVAFMKTSGLNRTALAVKIGSSPAYVTKILRGETNFTLDSMVKIATALGCELTIGLHPLPTPSKSKISYHDMAPQPSPRKKGKRGQCANLDRILLPPTLPACPEVSESNSPVPFTT